MKITPMQKFMWGSVTALGVLLSLGLAPISHAKNLPIADPFSQTSISLPEEPSGEEPGPSIAQDTQQISSHSKSDI